MPSERLKQLFSFLEASPEDSFLLFAIAKEYEKSGERQQAKDYYLRILQNDPAYVGTYYHLGKLYEAEENLPEALSTYTEGIKVAKEQGDRLSLNELAAAKLDLEY